MISILDTYPEFVSYWNKYREQPMQQRIDGWVTDYMGQWPELLQLQKDDYESLSGGSWRGVAETKVFPFIAGRTDDIFRAHRNLLSEIKPIHTAASDLFGIENLDVLFVLYVGIGCGAGWVTEYKGSHSVLFGLEMIAECGWSGRESIQGLVAHEIGHVVHAVLRNDPDLARHNDPFWQLYTEGFAQRSEHILLRGNTWHMQQGYNKAEWLKWCRANRSMLAKKFLHNVDSNLDTAPFFGSWFDIQGYSQCGYYLGHEVITDLEKMYSIKKIAMLENAQSEVRAVLENYL